MHSIKLSTSEPIKWMERLLSNVITAKCSQSPQPAVALYAASPHEQEQLETSNQEVDPSEFFTFGAENSDDSASDDGTLEPAGSISQQLTRPCIEYLKNHSWTVWPVIESQLSSQQCHCRCNIEDEALSFLGSGGSSVVLSGSMECRSSQRSIPVAVRCSKLFDRTSSDDGCDMNVLLRFHRHKAAAEHCASADATTGACASRFLVRCFGINVLLVVTTNSSGGADAPSSTCPHVVTLTNHELDARDDDSAWISLPTSVFLLSIFEKAEDSIAGQLIRHGGQLPVHIVRNVLLDVARALVYLHDERGVVHGDVKPQNVLLFRTETHEGKTENTHGGTSWGFTCKLSDLELARAYAVAGEGQGSSADGVKEIGGTVLYMSSMACKGIVHPSNDVWSLGIMATQLLTGSVPWSPLEAQFPSILLAAQRSENPLLPQTEELEKLITATGTMAGELARLVICCLEQDYRKRMTTRDLVDRLVTLSDSGF